MRWRERLSMYLLVTVVAILIWVWAAAETRDEGTIAFQLRITPGALTDLIVDPTDVSVNLEIEGSKLALEAARRLDKVQTLTLGNELPSHVGTHQVDLVDALAQQENMRGTGVRITSADPQTIDLKIYALTKITAQVEPNLPRVETDGEVKVTPSQVTLTLPSRLRDFVGEQLVLEAYIDQARLDRLEPGRRHSIYAKLRLPERLQNEPAVSVNPDNVVIELTVKSRIEETTLPSVRVQIAGPPEDHEEYAVEIDETDKSLRDVKIKAIGQLIRQIEQGQVTVVALIHLSNKEKERRIESKPVTCFMALFEDGTGQIVDAEVAEGGTRPIIHLRITDRKRPAN